MARLQLALPESYLFETRLLVQIGDINYGGHMGNDAFLRMAHESRLQWLKSMGYTEMAIEGLGLIMSDAAVIYKAEAFHGDLLRCQLGLCDFNRYGFDIVYLITHDNTGQEVARLKTGIVFFDYSSRKISPVPSVFMQRLADNEPGAAP